MSVLVGPALSPRRLPPSAPAVPERNQLTRRSLAITDAAFRLLCQLAACLIIAVAVLLVLVLIERSWLAIQTFGLSFLASRSWNPNSEPPRFGSLAFIYGTVATSAIAMLVALPLGVGTAAYLSEVASPGLRRVATFFIEMLAAIPSVIYGFWGIFALAPLLQRMFTVLGGPNTGGSGLLAAGLVLAVMIVPYIAAITYDVCQAVPRSQREGSLALGATRWQTIWQVVLPYARPGIVAGAFLALGRALGETMAVTMLIGNRNEISFSLFAVGDSIASKLANQYMEADNDLFRSVLVELSLILLLVTVSINTLARYLLHRVGRPGPFLPAWLTRPFVRPTPPAPAPVEAATAPALPTGGIDWGRPGLPETWQWVSAGTINRLMSGVLAACLFCTMGLLVVILSYLLVNGVGALDWQFFTRTPPPPTADSGGGLANAIWGTVVVVGWATGIAVPVGLLAAIYLAEYRPGPLARSLRFIAEQLGGVPSIVVGIFAASLFGVLSTFCERRLGVRIRFYGWSGVFALAVIMIPIVLRAAEEAIKLVPVSLRNASYALGASHAQTILRVVVPAALPAIITAIFLSVARVAGETAPLLLTAGFNNFWPTALNDFVPTLPPYIFKYATSPFENWQRLAWGAAFLLMVLVLLLNFGVRIATGKRVVQASRAD
ncbi:MAG: phosphate ABC transporter permease subunit PstC [Gemmataceae bacterium]